MKIGTVKEIKTHEYRVGLTPPCVRAYIARGHKVMVEKDAGKNAGFEDNEYTQAGATIVSDRKKIFDDCDMIVKVKEPLPEEYNLLHQDQILYTYLHLAASRELTDAMLNRKIKGVAYETIATPTGLLPCLKPMSEIAGRLSIQEGAKYLEKPFGGRGILLGGVPGIKRGNIAILGGGVSGMNACKMAVGIGANVTILDIDSNRLAYLDDIFGTSITTLYSNDANIENVLYEADLVIGAVLIPGAQAPHLIKRRHLANMKKGAVLVDIAVDQGGCAETTHPTTHDNPIYVVDGVVHYCVANMPGAVALSSTIALTNTTLRYGLLIAEHGLEKACRLNQDIALGVNVYKGKCVYNNVAKSLGIEYTPLESILE
ncbi:MAG: alanine dehydrogenase [Planctomycetes bacterium GWC2_45_44]|nr:MAG: alanine dehydrogenase [Planctomycetes bacterium GWC2_45_44]HBR19318.1 alanine dehydrogenase [Phycisphaerales bacterium]